MSDHCWISERWTYYLPLFTKEEIESCSDDLSLPSSRLTKITPSEERVFDRLVQLNKDVFNKLKIEVPYLIGAMTNYKFVEMSHFGDYMLSIDPNASKVRSDARGKLTSVDAHLHYCTVWQRVLKNSSEYRR